MAENKTTPRETKKRLLYPRVVVKLTGESLSKARKGGIDQDRLDKLAEKLVSAAHLGAQLAVVVGGGNILRGSSLACSKLIRQATAHQMGMTATVINGLALYDALRAKSADVALTSAMPVANFTEPYSPQAARRHLADGRIVILTCGTANAFVTTDTAAAIRAAELQAQAVLKATKVDGVYSDDPVKNPQAVRYDRLSYDRVINERLAVMDLSAVKICQQEQIPILVFNVDDDDSISAVLTGKLHATSVSD